MTMQYENMKIKALPAGTVVDNFIQGIGSYHYSDYLLEIVNETPFFLGKSKGEVYISPSSEAHGECDCISQHYQMDFKLIASKSELQARSIFSPQIYYDNGEAIYCASRIDSQSKNYHPIKATRIFAALRSLSLNDLLRIRKQESYGCQIDCDISLLMKTLETKKKSVSIFPL